MELGFLEILTAVPMTIFLSLVAIVCGLGIGCVNAWIRGKKIPVLRQVVMVYLSFMRGTPLLVQLYLVYFGLPIWFERMGVSSEQISPVWYACITLALHAGAFLTMTVESSVRAVPQDQLEAAYAVGMSKGMAYRFVILPQAIRYAIPLLENECTDIIKGTALVFSISVMEITAKAMVVAGEGLRFAESYAFVAILYLILCKALEYVFQVVKRRLERRMA